METNPILEAFQASNERLDLLREQLAMTQGQANSPSPVAKAYMRAVNAPPKAEPEGDTPRTVGEHVTKSAAYQAWLGGQNSTGRIPLGEMTIKAIVGDTATGDDNGYTTEKPRLEGLYANPQPALDLLNLFPRIAVDSGSVEFVQLDGYSSSAGFQAAQGDTKAETSVPTTTVTATIATLAHFVKASRQVLSDAPQLENQLSRLLTYGLSAKLADALLNGDGTSGSIKGLLAYASAATVTSTTTTDKIGEVVSDLQAAGYSPNGIVMAPSDWFTIASSKASTAGTYLLGSPASQPAPNLWGVRVVPSAKLSSGTVLIGDFNQSAILDREDASVRIDQSGDNFTANLVTLLAELRAGLAVFDSSAFKKLDIS